MNGWLTAASGVLLLGVLPAVLAAVTGTVRRRVTAQNLVTVLSALALLLLAQGYARPAYTDMALALAALGPTGTLVYARLLAGELTAGPPWPRAARALSWASVPTVPAVVMPLCFAAEPGRATVKLLFTGVLLMAGSAVCTRAMTAPPGDTAGTAARTPSETPAETPSETAAETSTEGRSRG